jgi:hypothetical protein
MIGITYLRFCKGFLINLAQAMTSFLDYGLRARGIEQHGIHRDGGYRSIFQPYAGMYVIFWCVWVSLLV